MTYTPKFTLNLKKKQSFEILVIAFIKDIGRPTNCNTKATLFLVVILSMHSFYAPKSNGKFSIIIWMRCTEKLLKINNVNM